MSELYKYRHLRNKHGKPIATVCVLRVDDRLYVGAAACHKRDSFNKAVGRRIAKQRADLCYSIHKGQVGSRASLLMKVIPADRRILKLTVETVHHGDDSDGFHGEAEKQLIVEQEE